MTEILPEYTIHSNEDGSTEQNFLTTYSEEETQESKINKANAKLVWLPQFVQFDPTFANEYDLTNNEAILYGFILFYMKNNKGGRFYFTNEQLAQVVRCYPDNISKMMKNLEGKDLIKTSKTMRAGGGLIRFVLSINTVCVPLNKQSPVVIKPVSVPSHDPGNKNSLNRSKLNINKDNTYILGFDKRPTKPPNNMYLKEAAQFEKLWERYPAKDGKKAAYKFFLSSVRTEQDWLDINTALNNYLQSERVRNGYVKNGSTWFNNWKDWVVYTGDPGAETVQQQIARLKKHYGEDK